MGEGPAGNFPHFPPGGGPEGRELTATETGFHADAGVMTGDGVTTHQPEAAGCAPGKTAATRFGRGKNSSFPGQG